MAAKPPQMFRKTLWKRRAKAWADFYAGRNIKRALEVLYGEEYLQILSGPKTDEAKREGAGVQSELFGSLHRNSDEELATFRKFPFLKEFWSKNRARNGKTFYELLGKRDRKLVDNWQNSIPQIYKRFSGPIREALESSGVYELPVEVPDGGLPSTAQEKAYRQYVRAEKKWCKKIISALVRYYQFEKQIAPEAFNWIKFVELPDKPTIRQMSRLLAFRDLKLSRASAEGVSTLIFRWSPMWDDEHGLSVVLYRGEVVLMDADAEQDLHYFKCRKMPRTVSYKWGPKQMTKAELKALKALVLNFRKADS